MIAMTPADLDAVRDALRRGRNAVLDIADEHGIRLGESDSTAPWDPEEDLAAIDAALELLRPLGRGDDCPLCGSTPGDT